jgi:hypothetical protein
MKTGLTRIALAALLLTAAVPSHAHGSMEPRYGGAVQMTGEIVFELVPAAEGLSVYLTEEDVPMVASRFTASAVVTAPGGAKTTHALEAQDGNRFLAPGVQLPKGSKVVVSIIDKATSAKTFATFQLT